MPTFRATHATQFVLEYATPRAGDIDVVGGALSDRELGLGVVNPRTAETEDPGWIVGRVEQALEHYRPDQLFLNPECGFGCFANRCVNDEETAAAKLRSIVAASRILRDRYA